MLLKGEEIPKIGHVVRQNRMRRSWRFFSVVGHGFPDLPRMRSVYEGKKASSYYAAARKKKVFRYPVKPISNRSANAGFRLSIGVQSFCLCPQRDTQEFIFSIVLGEQPRRRHRMLPIPAWPRRSLMCRPLKTRPAYACVLESAVSHQHCRVEVRAHHQDRSRRPSCRCENVGVCLAQWCSRTNNFLMSEASSQLSRQTGHRCSQAHCGLIIYKHIRVGRRGAAHGRAGNDFDGSVRPGKIVPCAHQGSETTVVNVYSATPTI